LDFLAISETGRWDFSQSLLNRIFGGIDFTWISSPPRGRSGDILLGVRSDTMEVLAHSMGKFTLNYTSMVGRHFTWANNLPEPTYEKQDRVLMDTDWELKFPMVTVRLWNVL
jgi:hypothetical protein